MLQWCADVLVMHVCVCVYVQCRHGFCWMCLGPWSKHNSSTGGYYECHRYKQKKETSEMLAKRKEEVRAGTSVFAYLTQTHSHHLGGGIQFVSSLLQSLREPQTQLIGGCRTQLLHVKEIHTYFSLFSHSWNNLTFTRRRRKWPN